MLKKRVLCVEDDSINAFIMEKLLGDEYEIRVVSTGKECLEYAGNEKFDVILLDINLGKGEKDGVHILGELRKIRDYERAPVFAITSYALPGDEQAFLSQGFDSYLSKPVDKNRLRAEIKKFIR